MDHKSIKKLTDKEKTEIWTAEQIIRRVSSNERIKSLCKNYNLEVSKFYTLVSKYPHLAQEYEAARLTLSDALADEIIDIADNEPDNVRARNMIDARKWYAAALRPSRYGNKIDVTVAHTVDIAGTLSAARDRLRVIDVTAVPVSDVVGPLGMLGSDAVGGSDSVGEDEHVGSDAGKDLSELIG